jgi:C4-type Zn-finger protein
MSNKRNAHLTCPYCKKRLPYQVYDIPYMQLILCDSEEGGCDTYFAVEIQWVPRVAYHEVR